MTRSYLRAVLLLGSAAVCACSADDGPASCHGADAEHCVMVEGGDAAALLAVANELEDNTALVLGAGTFELNNQLTIRASGIRVVGAGMDETMLDFAQTVIQVNGVDVVGDDFLIQDLTVKDAPKDGIRVEDSDGIVIRGVRVTWSSLSDPTNGAYGIYPVTSQNVLVEDSVAENASDAGLYVGQCLYAIVRHNTVTGNVAGLEIENTQYADVYDNTAEDNTAGIVVFDLPGNPVIGRDVRLRDNTIIDNNRDNFAPGGTVSQINAGTGTFALASRRVEITGNTYANNDTTDIAILSGLILEDEGEWELSTDELRGDWEDLGLVPGAEDGTIRNYRTENILIAGNSHQGSGTAPDTDPETDVNMLGFLLAATYGSEPVDSVLYDAIGESAFDPTDPMQNSNDNHLCVGGNTEGTFASMNAAAQEASLEAGEGFIPFFRPAAPFAPFDCAELMGGSVAETELP